MKKKVLNLMLLSFLAITFTSCNNANNSTTDPSSEESITPTDSVNSQESSSEIKDENELLENDQYTWMFENEQAYSNDLKFSVESADESSKMEVLIDDKPLEKLGYPDGSAYISYELDTEYPCHSDTIEHAYNEITFNGEVLGALPSDDSTKINCEFTSLVSGANVFSVTIGKVYVYDVKYDMEAVHGGINGQGDDFKIKNVTMTTSTGKKIWPSKMVFYKPKGATSAKYVTSEVQQEKDTFYWLSDGWNGNLSYAGHPDGGRYDSPFRIDYYFEWDVPLAINSYEISTKDYGEGEHYLTLKDHGEPVVRNKVYFDNGNPKASINIEDNQVVNQNFELFCKFEDDGTPLTATEFLLDGQQVTTKGFVEDGYIVPLTNIIPGQHNVTMYACDLAGNVIYDSKDFVIRENSEVLNINVENNNLTVNSPYEDTLSTSIYGANNLSYTTQSFAQSDSNKNPYDIFTVDVADASKDVFVSYNGSSFDGERIEISALNTTTSKYERVALANANKTINFKFNPTNYINDGKVTLKAAPLYVGNGSNRIIWSSDTQYLPKVAFTDLNPMYTKLMEYVANEYKNGSMAYMVHTGDIIDNNPSYKEDAIAEWEIATKAFDVLDKAEVPYGVLAGNHDVGTALSSIDYSYYSRYFGNFRYNDNDHFGGSLKDNECHYDLISIGNYDFVVVYIGFGIEWTPHTISWANEVLQRYSHRNAIVATHGYLLPSGEMDPDVQGQIIYDEIVAKNDNVKFVLCGHNDGTAKVKKQVNESRYVYELLHCYQFVETKKYSVSHLINGMKCNGEGFVKELIFNEDKLTCNTYSPVINSTAQPFGGDSYVLTVDLEESVRMLQTESFKAYQISGDALSTSSESTISYEFVNGQYYVVYSTNSTDGYGIELV